jgi:hypothetical protein
MALCSVKAEGLYLLPLSLPWFVIIQRRYIKWKGCSVSIWLIGWYVCGMVEVAVEDLSLHSPERTVKMKTQSSTEIRTWCVSNIQPRYGFTWSWFSFSVSTRLSFTVILLQQNTFKKFEEEAKSPVIWKPGSGKRRVWRHVREKSHTRRWSYEHLVPLFNYCSKPTYIDQLIWSIKTGTVPLWVEDVWGGGLMR